MSIRYRIVQNKMRGTANFGKWYGRAVIFDEVSTKELATEISHSTTVTYADVLAVLTELLRQMSVHLQNSQRVVLDGVGAFKVGLRTNLTEKSDSFTLANLKGYPILINNMNRLSWASELLLSACGITKVHLSMLSVFHKKAKNTGCFTFLC